MLDISQLRTGFDVITAGLTDRQIAFAYHYSHHKNGMKAVRDACYNHSTSGSQSSAAHRLLANSRVKQLIVTLQAHGV